MAFQRARQAYQIAERRASILKQARALCAEFGVMDWSLNELGRRSDVTKSNLYRYFSSREEILLVLMHEETRLFASRLHAETKDRQEMSVAELSVLIASLYGRQSLLCDLLCVSASLLENHAELETIRGIKLSGFEDSAMVASAIARVLRAVDEEQASQIAFISGIMDSGLWPMARAGAPVQRFADLDGLERLKMDFPTELKRMLEA
ncbi:TetR family transcriptional regulator [Leisingera sp. ANG-M1]|uniref:TetR family transcriptional regulator n=1 Tax=Leisingera sp. ANG-M1 TaxID=1577895 RepID=UPI0006893872|nr:TetR family transcriptional regulator [Leisingera sp. ANG-M1]